MAARAATVLLLAIGVIGCRWSVCTLPPETLAIADLRTIDGTLRAYSDACGTYPATLEGLGVLKATSIQPLPCAPVVHLDDSIIDHAAAGLMPPDKRPYALLYRPDGRNERGFQGYELEARWLGRDRDEGRSFWTSDAGVWTSAAGRPATEHDEPLR